MTKDRLYFLLLNVGHFLDHLFMLIFSAVAALALQREWGVSYASLLVYATPGFVAFGAFALPAGWLADRWSRDGMMVVYFIGAGVAAIATGFAATPHEIAISLFFVGAFAAIYHPVGLAIVSLQWANTGMRIAVNGVWGNLGVASAALLAGAMIDAASWRMALIVPGVFSLVLGGVYLALRGQQIAADGARSGAAKDSGASQRAPRQRTALLRLSAIVFLTTALTSLIFQSTTFALPRVLVERMGGFAGRVAAWTDGTPAAGADDLASVIGSMTFIVFAVASLAQLVVGGMLDRFGPRSVFMGVAALQVIFFAAMPGLTDVLAMLVALGFMLGAFGQIPINDFMISRLASGTNRARIFGLRFLVAFTVLALTLPLVAFVHDGWGFDMLFRLLAAAAVGTFAAASLLPRRLPKAEPVSVE